MSSRSEIEDHCPERAPINSPARTRAGVRAGCRSVARRQGPPSSRLLAASWTGCAPGSHGGCAILKVFGTAQRTPLQLRGCDNLRVPPIGPVPSTELMSAHDQRFVDGLRPPLKHGANVVPRIVERKRRPEFPSDVDVVLGDDLEPGPSGAPVPQMPSMRRRGVVRWARASRTRSETLYQPKTVAFQ